ncbi:hypothetical protein HMI54_008552 [Coelomomyces lativittatus]|nr:hypothetical protein HMI54_008552 [Coelomomyces lativittatus]KAJ1506537.1 hypothetical protein HMI56_000557 [Coelomomyces lativittatus]KAJ1513222.1 hypothetical protein HMI55_005796 [Coelomomyces lativittatus]
MPMGPSLLTSELTPFHLTDTTMSDILPNTMNKDVEVLLVSPPAGILSSPWAQAKLRMELTTKTGIRELPIHSKPKSSPYNIGVPSSPTLTYQEITSKGGVLSKQNVFPQPFKLFEETEFDNASIRRPTTQHSKLINTPSGETIFDWGYQPCC